MIRPMNIKNLERKMQDFNENLTLFEQQVIIIPYKPSGYVDYSNYGQINGQRNIDNYETYKRVWTGNDSFILTWKDSVEYTNTTNDTRIKYKYKIGDFFAGWLEQNSSFVDIAEDNSFSEYKSQTTEKSLTFRINAHKFNLDTNYEFMFYKVPELYGNIIFRVENLEREYLGNELMCYVLTLKSLNQELSNTGRAKQQNVMPSAPGDGYWDAFVTNIKPEGDEYKEFGGRYIVPNKDKQLINPCKKVVIKAFGMCALSNVAFWGRRVKRGNNFNNFGTPGWIFPMNFRNASTYTLYRTQNEQSNYYWVRSLSPLIQFDKDVFNAMKTMLSMNHAWSSEGFVQINKDAPALATGVQQMWDTNPVSRDSNDNPTAPYPEQLFGKVVGGKYTPWLINIKTNIERQTDLVYGCKQNYVVAHQDRIPIPIHDLMYHSFWTQKNMKTLPISMWNTLDFGWTINSALSLAMSAHWYSAAAIIGVGILATIFQLAIAPKFQGFSCIVPCSIMDFMVSETKSVFGENYLSKVKLSYFNSSEDNEINKYFNTETINTSFEGDLTDMIQYQYSTSTTKLTRTTSIGQKQDESGTYLLENRQPLLLEGKEKLYLTIQEDEGYIIDAIHIQGLFQGDYSIEFLDFKNDVIWSGIYQSQGKWAKSIREINTWINTSIYGRENMFLDAPLDWPKPLPELDIVNNANKPIKIEFASTELGWFQTYRKERNSPFWTMKQIFEKTFKERHTSTIAGIANFNTISQENLFKRDDIVVRESLSGSIEDFVKNYPTAVLNTHIYSIAPSSSGIPPYENQSLTARWEKKSDGKWKAVVSATKVFNYERIKFKIGPAEFSGSTNWTINLELKLNSQGKLVIAVEGYVSSTSFNARYSTPGQPTYTYVPYPEQMGGSVDYDRNWYFVDGDKLSSVSNGFYIQSIIIDPAQ